MKATELLKADHRNVFDLMNQLRAAGKRDALLLQRIYDSLKVHTQCEEEIFYPAMQPMNPDEIQRARTAHNEIDDLLEELMAIRIQKGMVVFFEVLNNLEQKLRQHVEEEEGKIFPEAEERLKGNLEEMGNRIEEYKIDLRTTNYGMAA
ncbi:MAG: hemerythrin domain-containing protein [Nitrospirae bacterium]|nr:hemerythrin domain-containing protein [Candidatus Manganitrophaceae bacterium]